MPSPIGHALGGIAAAWAVVPRRNLHTGIVLAAAALAPDLDLLVGDHRGISHSAGAAVAAGLLAGAWSVAIAPAGRRHAPRWAAAVTLAWASHVFLDWLSNDTRPPIGVMALWPIARDYYKAAIEIFPPVSRQCCGRRFWLHNMRAAVVELLIMAPLLWLALRRFKRNAPSH
ncbi:MAG TPA: metal-dependent hydrolase [Vicinamibacterales bacterium]|nr:metal-dependent hydrolase [Vicinamibacterales bacterium]